MTFLCSEFVADEPSVIVARLSGTSDACTNGEDTTCETFSASQFNGLFVAHFWAGGCAALATGFFIAKYGVYIMSLVSGGLLLVGMLCFTLGPYVDSSNGAFALMLTGRIIFAFGYFSNIVVSHQVKAHWFFGKELALSFTLHMISCRIGAAITFAAVGVILEDFGLQNTLWIVCGIGLISVVSACVAGWVYKRYASESIDSDLLQEYTETRALFDFSKLKLLGREYWVITGIVFFYCCTFFTFLADYPKFLTEYFHYPESKAGQITGSVAIISMIAPIFGVAIDKIGCCDIFTFIATFIFFLGFLLLAGFYNSVNPIIAAVLTAIAHAITTASLWSSIPFVTPPIVVGVAMGIATGLQTLGSGLWLLITGAILDDDAFSIKKQWAIVFAILGASAGLTWILSGVSMDLDTKNEHRPLRVRHSIKSTSQEPSENTPLISAKTE